MCPSDRDNSSMPTVASWSTELDQREQLRNGGNIASARKRVARRIGVAPGTLENIRRGRTKGVRNWIVSKIYDALMSEKQNEIRRLTHELEILRQCGVDSREDQIGEVEAHLAKAREILTGK